VNFFLRLMALISVLAAVACTPVEFFAVNAPTYASPVVVKKDISYGSDDMQKLDIYMPANNEKTPHDVVVFFYGGRWTTGDKAQYRFVGTSLAEKGFVVVIPNYRKYPAVKFPVFVEDGAKAVAWAEDHIAAYGGNIHKINIAGHSSGAHIGALIAANPAYLNAYGKSRASIHSFAGLAGPYAFTPDEPDLKDMFGPPSAYPFMQVPTFIDGHQPPMLLLYGDKDKTVGLVNLEKLKAAIKRKGGCVKSKIYPGLNHVWIIGSLSWLGSNKNTVLDDMVDFFERPACDY
jgi:acetyl esterase/lipase